MIIFKPYTCDILSKFVYFQMKNTVSNQIMNESVATINLAVLILTPPAASFCSSLDFIIIIINSIY